MLCIGRIHVMREIIEYGFGCVDAFVFADAGACLDQLRQSTVLEAETRQYVFLWIVFGCRLQASFPIAQQKCALFVWGAGVL